MPMAGDSATVVFAVTSADLMMTDAKVSTAAPCAAPPPPPPPPPCAAAAAAVVDARQGNSVLISGTHHIYVNNDGVGKAIAFDIVV